MGRKVIIAISSGVFVLVATLIIIAIVFNSNKPKADNKNVSVFKEAVNALNENQSFNKKGYEINFIENFDYEQKENTEQTTVDYKAHYEAKGEFRLSYENNTSNKISLEGGFQGLLQNGIGFISGVQSEKHVIQNNEINKATNEAIKKDDYDYTVNNNFVIDTTANNLEVYSKTDYLDNKDNTKNTNDSFSGKITKELLMNTYSLDKLNGGIEQLMFIDVWGNVNSLIELIYSSYKNVDLSNDEGLAKIIENSGFKFEKENDIIKITFSLDLNDEFKSEKNNYDAIDFLIEVDTKAKEVRYFRFDLAKYLASILKGDSDTGVAKVNNFYIDGKIINNTLNRTNLRPEEYKEYNEETKYEFLDEFVNHAIPGREDRYQ